MYCGQAGHLKTSCPVQPTPFNSKSVSACTQLDYPSSCVKIQVKIIIQDKVISTSALLDSGAAGNFVSHEFAQQHKLTLTRCNSCLAVEALDGHPIRDGKVTHLTEEIIMYVGVLYKEAIRWKFIPPTIPSLLVCLGCLDTTPISLGRKNRSPSGIQLAMRDV